LIFLRFLDDTRFDFKKWIGSYSYGHLLYIWIIHSVTGPPILDLSWYETTMKQGFVFEFERSNMLA
jgi:hypothetical protein